MKRFFRCVLLAACTTLVFSVTAMAAGGKIGYLDSIGAAMQSQWGKRINDELKKEEQNLSSALEQKGRAFVAAKEDYEKKRDVTDEKARNRKEKEIGDMYTELQKMRTDSNTKFNEQKNAAMAPLFKKMLEIATKIAKDDKYDFILDKNSIIVPNEKEDITSRVVSELNKSAPR